MKQPIADGFRDRKLAERLVAKIRELVPAGRTLRLMEVCGTHTMAISRTGIRSALAGKVDLISGPGCPVCVTAAEDIDRMIACADLPNTTVTTFGDMMRVPGSRRSLEEARAAGAKVQVVSSPATAVELAKTDRQRNVVFLGVGFETTAPTVAMSVAAAEEAGLDNFCIYSAHKRIEPAMGALLQDPGVTLDGFICPGHVAVVLGRQGFEFLAKRFHFPAVVAGFEPVDILAAILELVTMWHTGQPAVVNAYGRVVREEGNRDAREMIERFFVADDSEWRGLGFIADSGLFLRQEYERFDARRLLDSVPVTAEDRERKKLLAACRCGDVLKGKIKPLDCPLFASRCQPEDPVGPCMVSSEGACAAYFRFERGQGGRNG
ncbi:MAG: hydrogenase formation protein HypD [Bacillota bacterium]